MSDAPLKHWKAYIKRHVRCTIWELSSVDGSWPRSILFASVHTSSFGTALKAMRTGTLLLLLLYAGFFVLRSAAEITFPEKVSYTDPYMLKQIELLAHGQNIYLDINEPPYTGSIYAPIYLAVTALFSKFTGLTYFGPRLISFVGAILVGLMVFLIVFHRARNTYAAAIASLLIFASHYFYSWTPAIRSDTLALLFSVSAIYVVDRSQSLKSTLLASLLVFLAFYTRQTYLAASAAIFVYLLLNNQRRALVFLVASFVPAALVFGAVNYVLEGQFFEHLVRYNTNPVNPLQAVQMYYKLLTIYPVIIALAGFYVLRALASGRLSLLVIWFFTASLFSLGVAKEGAWINYFLELFTVMAILIGVALGSADRVGLRANSLTPILLFIQTVAIFHMPGLPQDIQEQRFFFHYVSPVTSFTESELAERQRVLSIMESTAGKKLLYTGDFMVQAYEKDIYEVELPSEPFVYGFLANKGLWNPATFGNRLSHKEFSLIIADSSASFSDFDYYEYARTTRYSVWKPREE